eukprot:Rmarinus@m.8251
MPKRRGVIISYRSVLDLYLLQVSIILNAKKINQDACHFEYPYDDQEHLGFFAVWDGHGVEGRRVSQFAVQHIAPLIRSTSEWKANDRVGALISGILRGDADLRASGIPAQTSGCTGVHALLDLKNAEILCANVGDSRCVLAKETKKLSSIALSDDHKPDNKEEKKRIIKARGRVAPWKTLSGEELGPARVWLKEQNIPGLAMSRSIGDFLAKQVGVIAEAEVKKVYLCPEHKFFILASDGVWEFISNDEACELVNQFKNPDDACKALIELSQKRWRAEEEVVDDITAVVVYLDWTA